MSEPAEEIVYTDEEAAALDQLRQAMEAFAVALVALDNVGMKPSEGLRSLGLDVPTFAAPMLDNALKIPKS